MRLRKNSGPHAVDRGANGFTLSDLLFALAVMGVLVGLAVPSYRESVRKSKRAEARAALMQLMQQEERFYSEHNSYITFSFASSGEEQKKFKWFSGNSAKSSAYEMKAEACQNDTIDNCVLLTAQPGTYNVDMRYKDPVCGELGLTSTGIKTAADPDCWK